MEPEAVDRRSFLARVSASCAVTTVPFAPAVDAPTPARKAPLDGAEFRSGDEITKETIAEAAQLIGLEFSEDERARLARGAKERREGFRALRAMAVPDDVAPAAAYRVAVRPEGVASVVEPALAPVGIVVERPADGFLGFLPVTVLARFLKTRKLSAVELTRHCLERLDRDGRKLHAVVQLLPERALRAAEAADQEIAAGRLRGPLHGIPYGLKDLFAVRGTKTTWGARPYRERTIDQDCAVYERLRAAGAILVAKLSLGSLAMGDLWFEGRTRNPWNTEQGSSGSSAGSAAAVAAGLVPLAIGTETLGSIVSPCSRCGVSGLRPTFGRISRFGAMPLAFSMDKVGPIARTAEDLGLAFDALVGADPRDPSTVDAPFSLAASRSTPGRRVGYVPAHWDGERFEPERQVLDALRDAGHELVAVEPPTRRADPLLAILDAEAAAAFDDFLREGHAAELDGQGPRDWPDQFRSARFVPAVEYLRADRLRRMLASEWETFLRSVDVYVTPSFRGGSLVPTNLTGHPACVVPSHRGERGTFATTTFVARAFDEASLLAVASAWQARSTVHLDRPPPL